MRNPIGVISMFYARPFGPVHLALLPRIKAAGFDFIELLVPEPGELDLPLARQALDMAGLGVALAARVSATRDLTSSDSGMRAAGLDYLKRAVDTAVTLGAKIVGGPLYGGPLVFAGRAPAPVTETLRRERERWATEGLAAAGAFAGTAGVTLAVEPLNRFETDILNTTRQGIALVEAVARPSVGLLLDTFHMNMEDPDIAGAIRAAGRHLVHFQANENHRGFVGTGHVDWRGVCRALAEIGYRGPITLEPFRRDDERIAVPLAQWRLPGRDESAELIASRKYLQERLADADAGA